MLVPDIHPRWFVAGAPEECFTPGPFPSLSFQAWLPSFRRTRQLLTPNPGTAAGLSGLR
jgi:hypothetical protein